MLLGAFGVSTATQKPVSDEFVHPGSAAASPVSSAVSGALEPFGSAPLESWDAPYLVAGTDLVVAATPLTASDPGTDGTLRYRVQRGETVSGLAARFGITPETIRWANPSVGRELRPGTELTILPVSGLLYSVSPGDSLATVGERYHVDSETVRRLNPRYLEVFADGAGSLILADAEPVSVKKSAKK